MKDCLKRQHWQIKHPYLYVKKFSPLLALESGIITVNIPRKQQEEVQQNQFFLPFESSVWCCYEVQKSLSTKDITRKVINSLALVFYILLLSVILFVFWWCCCLFVIGWPALNHRINIPVEQLFFIFSCTIKRL